MRPKIIRKPGPKTPEAKARSSLNAIKHGLHSSQALLRDEDPAELEHLRLELFAELKPVGYLQELYADIAVTAAWRIRRAIQVETANMDKIYAEVYAIGENLSDEDRRKRALVATFSNRYVDFIREHIAAFHRDLCRARQELAYLQASSKTGEPIPFGSLRVSLSTGRPRGRPRKTA